jgi:perosamine synthetase
MLTNPEPVPVNEPLLSGNEKKYLTECIDTGWVSSEGPFVKKFESAFAASVGRKHGIAVTSGTAALQAGVAALDISDGDEVILPAFTIISCAAAVVRAGAVPVLVDCDPITWNMEVSQIEAKITPKTKAIMPVHIYGLPVDMAAVETIAKKHNLKIIEDAAEAHGQSCYDRPCGSFGDISIFSFYPNKLITTGEGCYCRPLQTVAKPVFSASQAVRPRRTRMEFPNDKPAGRPWSCPAGANRRIRRKETPHRQEIYRSARRN